MNHLKFTAKPFAECVDFCMMLDKVCFPEEMWLESEDVTELINAQAKCIVVSHNNIEIGLGMYVSDKKAELLLHGADQYFIPIEGCAYSYSEAIHPDFQNKGIGTKLLQEIANEVKKEGYKFLSAHARMRHGWNLGRKSSLRILDARTIHDFWEDPDEPVQYQIAEVA